MKSEDLDISDNCFIGIVLYLGISSFLLLFNIKLAVIYYFAVLIYSFFVMILNAKEKEKKRVKK